jgi:hypothetical protein
MNYTKSVLAFGTFALGLAMAASHHNVTFANPTWVEGHQLQPGEYRVEIEGDKALIKGSQTTIEVPAKVETSAEKYDITSSRSQDINGKHQLEEIQFGGTKTRILFEP